jgi:hypothetical protein
MPMTSQFDALTHYQAEAKLKVEQAQERVLMFEAGIMSYGDTWPPYKDCTPEAIDRDKLLIENHQQVIETYQEMIDRL